jgi:nucleoside-diphosphate-sugar epimerase
MSGVKTVLVTGANGLVGHGICTYLLRAGYNVVGTTQRPMISAHSRLRLVQLELTDASSINDLGSIFPEIDVLIHVAAIIPKKTREFSLEQGLKMFNVNAIGTYHLLKLFSAYPEKKLVYISGTRLSQTDGGSFSEDLPFSTTDEYSSSKLLGEVLCRQFLNQGKLFPSVLRISAPYGYVLESNAVIPRFIKQVRSGEDIELWGTGSRAQTFTFVEDIARACELSWKNEVSGVFNITSGQCVSMRELADSIIRSFPNSKSKIVLLDKVDPQERVRTEYSIEKAARDLGYTPAFSIDSGIDSIAKSLAEPVASRLFDLV